HPEPRRRGRICRPLASCPELWGVPIQPVNTDRRAFVFERSPKFIKFGAIDRPLSLLWAPRLAEEPDPVAMQDACDRFRIVTTVPQQVWHALQIGDGIEVARGLLTAKSAVEVGADSRMPGVA